MNKYIFLALTFCLFACSKTTTQTSHSPFPSATNITNNSSPVTQNPIVGSPPTSANSNSSVVPSPKPTELIVLAPPSSTASVPAATENKVAKVESFMRCTDKFEDEIGLPVYVSKLHLFTVTPDQKFVYIYDNKTIYKLLKGESHHTVIHSTKVNSDNVWWLAYKNGELYFTDLHQVKKITSSGKLEIVAGQISSGYQDGDSESALFKDLRGIALDNQNNIYVSERGNSSIRKISLSERKVSTLVGPFSPEKGSDFAPDGPVEKSYVNDPAGLTVDFTGKRIFVVESVNRIRKIEDGNIMTIAGSGKEGYKDAIGNEAEFRFPMGIQLNKTGLLYIADTYNNVLREINTSGNVQTVAGNASFNVTTCREFNLPCSQDGIGSEARFNGLQRLTQDDNNNLYVDNNSCLISKISFTHSPDH